MKNFFKTLVLMLVSVFLGASTLSVAAEVAYPIDLPHQSGTTTIAAEPERIVVMDYAALDTLDAIGAGDKIVGIIDGNLPEHLANYQELPTVGTAKEADIEAIATLEPDLVVVGNRQSSNYEAISEFFPTIDASVSWDLIDDENTYTDNVKLSIETLGQATNQTEGSDEKIAEIDALVETYQDTAEGSAIVLMSNGGEISMHSEYSRFAPIFEIFGFENIGAEAMDEGHKGEKISFETVQSLNPDWIFVLDRDQAFGGDEAGQPAQEVLDNELVNSTTAAQEGQIVYLSPVEWYLVMTGANNYQTIIEEIGEAIQE